MDDAGKKKLLEEYAKTKSPETRETIILEYAPLVKVVAGRLSMYLGYNVEYEDLVSYGIFGLIDAIDKFDCLKDVKFETYASLRIRGAILDQIRKMDWIPRTIRQKQKKIEAVIKEIEQSEGRAPMKIGRSSAHVLHTVYEYAAGVRTGSLHRLPPACDPPCGVRISERNLPLPELLCWSRTEKEGR